MTNCKILIWHFREGGRIFPRGWGDPSSGDVELREIEMIFRAGGCARTTDPAAPGKTSGREYPAVACAANLFRNFLYMSRSVKSLPLFGHHVLF